MTRLEALSLPLELALENLIAERASLHSALDDIAQALRDYEESEGWKRLLLPSDEFFTLLIETAKQYPTEKTAAKAITQKIKQKLINQTVQDRPVGRVEALRLLAQYELQVMHRKKRLYYQTPLQQAARLFFPYKYQIGRFNTELVKLDIHACFWTLYARLGLDVNVKADIDHTARVITLHTVGRGIMRHDTSPLIRALYPHKELRNALYGLTRATWAIWYYPPEPTAKRSFMRGALQNLDLTVAIASTLHALLYPHWQGVLYWNIDGGVVTPETAQKLIKDLTAHGFTVTTQVVTDFEVKALGAYILNGKASGHYNRVSKTLQPAKDYIYKVQNKEKILNWLKEV